MDVPVILILILAVLGAVLMVANRIWSKRRFDRSGPSEPGWYDDPEGVGARQAYWDGQGWTGQTRTRWENTKKPWVVISLGVGLIALAYLRDEADRPVSPVIIDASALIGFAGVVVLVWTIGLLVIRWLSKRLP